MKFPTWGKPVLWGAAGGAIAAVIIGFAFLGWVTGGTAEQMRTSSAEAAIVQAFTPICVQNAQEEPEQMASLKETSSWKRDDFVIEAGWADNVGEKHRTEVARSCAKVVVAAME